MLRTCVVLALVSVGAEAAERPWPPQASESAIFLVPERFFWRDALPGLPEAAKFVALEGNPSVAGPFTLRMVLPAGTKIPPVSFGHEYRLAVLAGSLHLGFGVQYDEAQFQELPSGGFWACPAWHVTSFLTRQDTVIQLSGTGPLVVKYANAADDPRTKAPPKE